MRNGTSLAAIPFVDIVVFSKSCDESAGNGCCQPLKVPVHISPAGNSWVIGFVSPFVARSRTRCLAFFFTLREDMYWQQYLIMSVI